jgi:hypothetical protein
METYAPFTSKPLNLALDYHSFLLEKEMVNMISSTVPVPADFYLALEAKARLS